MAAHIEKPFPAYAGEGPYAFVSYAHEDAALVFPEMQRLQGEGFNIWYDDGIRPGTTWREEVALALTESSLFIYFVTENSVKSENCHQELNFALSRERKILAVHLTPVRLTAGIELSLSNKQAIMRSELTEEQFATKLGEAVRALMPAPIMTSAVVQGRPSAEPSTNSVAILPFVNRSSDAENEYLCDGIAEELITGLAKIEGLRVASQLQSFAYKGQVQDIGAIGAKLKVANVLTGSIQRSGERVRVTATLSETGTGDVIWSERYDGTIEDVFDLQEDVANKVVSALEVQFGRSGETQAITEPGTRDSVAYQHYMLGRYEFMKFTRQSFLKAHDHFADATAADPGYGRAWYLDFTTWCVQRTNGHISQEACYPLARASLERSRACGFVSQYPPVYQDRELDPALIPSHDVMVAEAIAALQNDDSEWHGFQYAMIAFQLASAGLLHGACDYWEHYMAAYPAFAEEGPTLTNYGNVLFALGRFEKAIDHFSAVYARQPSQVLALGTRAMAYSRTGQYAKAAADLEELAKTFPRNFAQFYDLYWRRELDAATAYFDWMEAQKNLQPVFKIWGCFLLGHIERGLDHIEAAGVDAFGLRVMSLFALTPSIIREVTSHPRYQTLLDAQGAGRDWQEQLMTTVNGVEHITGIHVGPDEDY